MTNPPRTGASQAPRVFHDLIVDPRWTDLVNVRWSDPNDTGENVTDIADETLAYIEDGEDVAEARLLIAKILKRIPVAELRSLGVVEIKMADIVAGLKGRVGWAFVVRHRLFLVVLHSAFEDNIPGQHLDDGRNAFTELQLMLIRSRRAGTAHYAFSTRRARKYFNRVAMNRALKAYNWRAVIGGKEVDFANLLVDAMEGTKDEEKTIEFHTASGRGELDDLDGNL
ncbi:hypothetical protein GB931_17035 [Modestobacter sp. I12A-02628]|uniref:Uncharacterized protein n=1 Tax=Goekera deserti TaxID=2497753 RepID=A0A7K3WE41_9ACTN|nr:hypothetical protein [Goekera deserti]MPQ99590.1 hypothetical protein [Goekera deserti]NDI46400.1 hypothetical protein [Goekera deserti]NEL54667.1 hypothetical protein [Goekera deserti]